MVRRYPDAEATMGEAKKVGEAGPDEAGKTLSPTAVKVRIFSDRSFSSALVPLGLERRSRDVTFAGRSDSLSSRRTWLRAQKERDGSSPTWIAVPFFALMPTEAWSAVRASS
ncbi:hypothetical protein ACHAWF_018396 [Thalassiosira exigua]